MLMIEAWQAMAPSDFPNNAASTWGPDSFLELLGPGHRWPLMATLVGDGKKKGKN